MFERDITEAEVENAVKDGIIIESYPNDTPYPSFLCLFDRGDQPLHVVYALDDKQAAIIITVYRPDTSLWEADLKTRKEEQMKCMICKHGSTIDGTATVTLEKNGATIIFKNVPAQICTNCGEQYVEGMITKALLKQAHEIYQSGVQIDIREYSLTAA